MNKYGTNNARQDIEHTERDILAFGHFLIVYREEFKFAKLDMLLTLYKHWYYLDKCRISQDILD